MSALVVTIRCFHCPADCSAIGPAAMPTVEYPGWFIDQAEFYNPNGHHLCPEHQRRAWVAYCGNLVSDPMAGLFECEPCLVYGGIIIDAPLTMAPEDVTHQLRHLGVLCGGRNEIIDVEPCANYMEVQPEVAARL